MFNGTEWTRGHVPAFPAEMGRTTPNTSAPILVSDIRCRKSRDRGKNFGNPLSRRSAYAGKESDTAIPMIIEGDCSPGHLGKGRFQVGASV